MRKLCNGEVLMPSELKEIVNNLGFTVHSEKRMNERGIDKNDVKNYILNSLIAYFNTDGTINIAINEYNYFVVKYNSFFNNYVVITFKEKSNNNVSVYEKRILASKGIDRENHKNNYRKNYIKLY